MSPILRTPQYVWILHGILLVLLVGVWLKEKVLGIVGGVSMLVYFFTISRHYQRLGSITRRAAMTGTVKYSGSKWSFSNPLRITLAKAMV